MRKRSSRASLESDEASINLTSLIDVVFVVLIVFILIAPMLEIDKIELAQGADGNRKESALPQEKSPVNIHVKADNSIWVNGKRVNEAQLKAFLISAYKQNPHRTPQLFHDKKGQFGTYQSVKNAVESAGFEQMDVILKPG